MHVMRLAKKILPFKKRPNVNAMCVKLNERVSGETKHTYNSIVRFRKLSKQLTKFRLFAHPPKQPSPDTLASFFWGTPLIGNKVSIAKRAKRKSEAVAFRDTASASQQFRYLFAIAFAFTLFQSHSFPMILSLSPLTICHGYVPDLKRTFYSLPSHNVLNQRLMNC